MKRYLAEEKIIDWFHQSRFALGFSSSTSLSSIKLKKFNLLMEWSDWRDIITVLSYIGWPVLNNNESNQLAVINVLAMPDKNKLAELPNELLVWSMQPDVLAQGRLHWIKLQQQFKQIRQFIGWMAVVD